MILRHSYNGIVVDLGFDPKDLLGDDAEKLYAYLAKLVHLNGAGGDWALSFGDSEEVERPLSYWIRTWEAQNV